MLNLSFLRDYPHAKIAHVSAVHHTGLGPIDNKVTYSTGYSSRSKDISSRQTLTCTGQMSKLLKWSPIELIEIGFSKIIGFSISFIY